MAIEEILDNDRCVFTNPTCGLTDEDAEKAIGILTRPKRKAEAAEAQPSTQTW